MFDQITDELHFGFLLAFAGDTPRQNSMADLADMLAMYCMA